MGGRRIVEGFLSGEERKKKKREGCHEQPEREEKRGVGKERKRKREKKI
jgi:hypothetical protein